MKKNKLWLACGIVGGILLVGCAKGTVTQNNSLSTQSANGMQAMKPTRMLKPVDGKALYRKSKEK